MRYCAVKSICRMCRPQSSVYSIITMCTQVSHGCLSLDASHYFHFCSVGSLPNIRPRLCCSVLTPQRLRYLCGHVLQEGNPQDDLFECVTWKHPRDASLPCELVWGVQVVPEHQTSRRHRAAWAYPEVCICSNQAVLITRCVVALWAPYTSATNQQPYATLIMNIVTGPGDPRRAIPQKLTFVVKGRPDIDMDLTGLCQQVKARGAQYLYPRSDEKIKNSVGLTSPNYGCLE